MLSSMQTDGLKELDKALAALGSAAGSKALVAALKDASEPVYSTMVADAPIDEGVLQDSIKVRSKKSKGAGSTSGIATVGTPKKVFHSAIAAEFGTKDQKAKPFIRLALEKNWQKSVSIFSFALKKRIQQQAKRLAKLTK
jgi:HK97 gp10 family phage protein